MQESTWRRRQIDHASDEIRQIRFSECTARPLRIPAAVVLAGDREVPYRTGVKLASVGAPSSISLSVAKEVIRKRYSVQARAKGEAVK